jgi:DNA-binding transcriptional MerR regulator
VTTAKLCRQIGITLRQAQWWCEKGVLRCDYVDGSRSFDEMQALVAAIVAELRRKGVPLPTIRRMQLSKPTGDFLVVCMNGAAARRWCGEAELIACVVEAPGPCLVVAVEDLRRRLHA